MLTFAICAQSARCTACNQDEVDDVYKAAKAAYKGWAKTPLWKRAEYLHKVAALLKENAKVGRTRQNDT